MLSWNVWLLPPWSSNTGNRTTKIAALLDREKFDIVSLQEVWRPDSLRSKLQEYDVVTPEDIDSDKSDSGLMLLLKKGLFHQRSRWALSYESSSGEDTHKSKGAMFVELEDARAGGYRIGVAITHLQADATFATKKASEAARLAQANELRARLADIPSAVPVLLMGDFNVDSARPPNSPGDKYADLMRAIHGLSPDEALPMDLYTSVLPKPPISDRDWVTYGKNKRFDYVFAYGREPLHCAEATIRRFSYKQRKMLSDHAAIELRILVKPR